MLVDEAVLDAAPDAGAIEEVAEPVDSGDLVGDVEEVSVPEPDTETVAEQEPVAEETSEEEQPAEEVEPPSPDGRKLPDDVKKAIKAIQATNPNAAGKIRDGLFELQAIKAVFPTVGDAATAKEFIESVGGPEGLQSLRSDLDAWQAIDQAYAEGSPDFVKGVAESNPEAFAKMVPNAVNLWAEKNPDLYGIYANSVAVNTLMGQPGVEAGLGTLQELHNLLANPEWMQQSGPAAVPFIQRAIASVINGVVGLRERASELQQKQQQKPDPKIQQFEQQKQQWEQKVQQEFEADLTSKRDAYILDKAKPWIEQATAGLNLPEGFRDIIDEKLPAEVISRLAKLGDFDQRLDSLEKTRNGKDALAHYQRGIDKIIQAATETVTKRYTRGATPAAASQKPPVVSAKPVVPLPVAKATVRSTGPLQLKSPPDMGQIDRAKTPNTDFLLGRAVLKDGRQVTW
jgi:hypothetical protein